MSYEKNLFKIIHKPYFSEKTCNVIKRSNKIVLKVDKNATKIDIKNSIIQIFGIEIDHVCTLVVKGKKKKYKNKISYRNNWKKAYITIKKGQNLDFISNKNYLN